MRRIDTIECGGITGAAEMLAIKDELRSIWMSIRTEHPVDVLEAVYAKGPLSERVADAIATIPRIRQKKRVILVGPELVALEGIAHLGLGAEVVVAVDRSLGGAVINRVANNIPRGVSACVTNGIPDIPTGPSDSILIAVGFLGGYRFALVPSWIASVVRRYAAVFSGDRVLVDPVGRAVSWRRNDHVWEQSGAGWVTEMLDSLFTDVASPLSSSLAPSHVERLSLAFPALEVNT